MKVKINPIIIPADNPFENDLLNREEQANILTDFILNIDTPYVLAIDGDWGSGKTTFVSMWKQLLEKKEINTIYIDAWSSDYHSDPFIPIAKEIEIFFKNKNGKNVKLKKYINSAKNVSKYLIKKSVPTAVSIITHGQINLDNNIENSIAKLTENISSDAIKEYELRQKSLEKLKENLAILTSKENNPTPLVIIIDELDRCRPTYAIEFLERIKHFFSIDNIIFVLVENEKQIQESIKSIYGNIDSAKYLTKFIDYIYKMKKPTKNDFIEAVISKYDFNSFFEKRKKHANFSYDTEQLVQMSKIIFNSEKVNLRDIEQIISHLSIVIKLTTENQFLYPSLILFLIYLRKYDYSSYEKIQKLNYDPIDFLNEICTKNSLPNAKNNTEILRVLALIEHSKSTSDHLYDVEEKYRTLVINDDSNYYSKLLRTIEHYNGLMYGSWSILSLSIEKIELLKPIVVNIQE